MKQFISIAVVCFFAIVLRCPNSFAEDAIKIGYVDINKVFDAYDKAKGISKSVEAEREKGRSERKRREEEIKKKNKELQDSTLGKEEKEKREKSIQKKIKKLVEFDRAQRKKEHEPIRKGLSEIYKVVQKVGEKEGFDLILEKRDGLFGKTVLFGKKSLDLTDKVIKELLKK